jgi:hypothetical protein
MSDMYQGAPRHDTVQSETESNKLNSFQEILDKLGPRPGENWITEEYEKHVQEMRDRYPMLTSMLLKGTAQSNANLSSQKNTNKYARLADAYNAQMRYVPTTQVSGAIGSKSVTTGGKDPYEAVNKLETQDQKQMEQLREAQGDLRKYGLGEESYFQRQHLDKKFEEMKKLVDQGYEQQFFNANEQMRRTKELFDNWAKMDLYQFQQVTDMLQIPKAKADILKAKLAAGDYIGAAIQAEAFGLTPMALEQVYQFTTSAPLVTKMMNNTISPEAAAAEMGRLKGHQFIQQFNGIIVAGKQAGGVAAEAANAIEGLVHGAVDVAGVVSDHPKITALLVTLGPLLQQIAGGIIKATAGGG